MKKIILAVSAALTLAACQISYDKTPSGLVYKIFPGKGGDSLKVGQFVRYSAQFVLTGREGKKDSLLNADSYLPGYFKVDTGGRYAYSYFEIMPKLRVGDSVVVMLNTDSLKNKGGLNPADSVVFVKGSTIQCQLKIVQSFKDEKDVMADYNKELELENKRETKSAEDYMTQKGYKGIKTKSGAYVVIDNAGDLSMKADTGKIAMIKYKGYLQSDGKVFDTNFDSSKGHTDPYPVTIGGGGVIPAWQEALPNFGKGGTGKIIVPAFLGYGERGNEPVIPPFANLVFDIQVVDVQAAPPPSKTGGAQLPPGE